MQNCDTYHNSARHKFELKLFDLEEVKFYFALKIMVFLKKLKKFSVFGNRFRTIYYEKEKNY